MDTGFSYGDIIVFAAIAAFILLRYRAMLGEKSGRDDLPRTKPTLAAEYERVIQLPAASIPATVEKKEDVNAKYGTLAETFVTMRGIDREFSPDEFLQGARTAYEMVIEAFSKADRDTLKLLLADALYKNFDSSITNNRSMGRVVDTTLVAITKADIADAKLSGTTAIIAVDFTSEQIHLVRDTDGKIIEGAPSQEDRVEDHWVFSRNLTNTDPNWKIIES
jgi:predicted lipid-binding transport protein (Tim44 family)